jgi:peptidoglycan/xylan/chitin deacetylase (PgdA/CDA1 family)
MNRRDFTKALGLSVAALNFAGVPAIASRPGTQFSITMDDFYWQGAVHLSASARNDAILDTLNRYKHKAALFVVGRNLEDDEGKELLKRWDKAGHMIGNHTYSHRNFNARETDVSEYQQDILRAEKLLTEFKRFKKYFRFPMLKEGNTLAKRESMRFFLKINRYQNGHVTIDASDWAIDQRLTARLKKDPGANLKPYRDFYLEHMWARSQYYERLAEMVLGRPVKHTLLVHFNLLNGLFLGDLLEMYKGKGWRLVDAEEAFTDPVFAAKPNVVPAGESLLWSLAKENGKIAMPLRYPGEDAEYENARMDKLGL